MNVAIVGAGALGSGFLLPMLREAGCNVTVYDERHGSRWTKAKHVLGNASEREIELGYLTIRDMGAFVANRDEMVFTATPPSALLDVARHLERWEGKTVVACENLHDPATFLSDRVGRDDVRFVNGIAWVSAFFDGATNRWWCDEGDLCVDGDVGIDSPLVRVTDMYDAEYREKRVLHNGPHAVLAYLGWRAGCRTIPEAMHHVEPHALWSALAQVFPASGAKLEREVLRFSDRRFPDPVERVARSPWRKLMRGGRLPLLREAVGEFPSAARIVDAAIDAAIEYGLMHDPVVSMWFHHMEDNAPFRRFKREYCGL